MSGVCEMSDLIGSGVARLLTPPGSSDLVATAQASAQIAICEDARCDEVSCNDGAAAVCLTPARMKRLSKVPAVCMKKGKRGTRMHGKVISLTRTLTPSRIQAPGAIQLTSGD